jgi:predicted NAD-dependent protein-ADP-ribosyltransferase YbiA (DUF1768 family)
MSDYKLSIDYNNLPLDSRFLEEIKKFEKTEPKNLVINQFIDKYKFLSNSYDYDFFYNGTKFKNVEQAYQYMKSIIKKENEVYIMEDILRSKFFVTDLKDKILQTEESRLVNGNYSHENYWGDCLCVKCDKKVGFNHLGELLMKIRKELEQVN